MAAVRRSARMKPPSLKAVLNFQLDQRQPRAHNLTPTRPQLEEKAKSTSPTEEMDTSPEILTTKSDTDNFVVEYEEGVWSKFKELCQLLPGRQAQVELLLTLFGEPSSPTSSPLYLYGNTGTGKTLTIKTVLEAIKTPFVLINCVECFNSQVLYDTILRRVIGLCQGVRDRRRCGNLYMFVRELQQIVSGDEQLSKETLYIVLDKAERLRELEHTVLSALLRLKELSGCRVCVVLVSVLPYERLSCDHCPSQLISIHFSDYSRAETLTIMSLDRHPEDSTEFFATFSNHIWNVFHIVCRDLGELRHLSSVLYPKYREPVISGEIGMHEIRRLWKHIEPFFKDIMSRIYLRELSTQQGERALATPTNSFGDMTDYLELPYYSKYLLLSSFLASYNPAKADKKFFSKTKQPKGRKSHKLTKEKPNHQLLGPKPFPLDRLMAIFYSILEEDTPPAAHLYSQVASLVTLQLLAQVGSGDCLDTPKYKCLLTLEHIRLVARSVGFDIVSYLYDFN